MGASDNVVEGNYIGTDVTGTHALGKVNDGVLLINGAQFNTIGGTTALARNIISGNAGPGVALVGPGTKNNVVEGDYIGTDVTGAHALGNGASGVWISGGAQRNTIGGTTAGARDVISGNVGNGVFLTDSGTMGNVVTGDFIGTAMNGTGSLGNSGDGVFLNGVTANSITNSVICFNGAYGIEGISGSNAGTNTITGDVFTVTIGTTTYGNKLGATWFH
jgi:titin